MAARLLLLQRSTSSSLFSQLQAAAPFSSSSSSLVEVNLSNVAGFDGVAECAISSLQGSEAALPSSRSRSALWESEAAAGFVGLNGNEKVSGTGWSYTSLPGGAKRSMYTKVAAARVGRRPPGIPESYVDALHGIEEMAAGAGATGKMSIVLKSFEKIQPGKLNNVSKVGLPTTRILTTVNRSPHVDKKSREQFEMQTRNKLLVMDMDVGKLREKYNELKNHNMLGVQLKVSFHYKTLLDMSRIKGHVMEAALVEQSEAPKKLEENQ